MRNSTKLKLVLSIYDAQLSVDDDACFKLVLMHRKSGHRMVLGDKNFTKLMNNAYSAMKKELKDDAKIIANNFSPD